MHANVGGDSGEDEIVDAARAQDELEVGGAERAFARLVDDRLPRQRLQLIDRLPARLAADENAPARAFVPDAGADALRAPALVVGQVGEIGAVPLPSMDDVVTLRPRRREQR